MIQNNTLVDITNVSPGFSIVICSQENEVYKGRSLCNIDYEGGDRRDTFDIITAESNSKLSTDHSLQTGNT